jgi:hypothetical protein
VDKQLEQYFNNYFDLFGTDGWKQLIEELNNNALGVNNLQATKDSEDMYFRKGQLNVLASIINLQNTIEASHKEASEAPEDD